MRKLIVIICGLLGVGYQMTVFGEKARLRPVWSFEIKLNTMPSEDDIANFKNALDSKLISDFEVTKLEDFPTEETYQFGKFSYQPANTISFYYISPVENPESRVGMNVVHYLGGKSNLKEDIKYRKLDVALPLPR